MNDQEKLRVLIPHWIEHNHEHADEFRRWAEQAGDAAPDIQAAAEAITRANESLAAALKKLGGAASHHHHKA
ncbi:MAG TPA: hypothetical protein G4N96_05205 [Chloroflexi bacterium]|nr:MAG: hypothetical protein B6243_08180 [Anaerolineaceae bacterium 4572_5.2]HEY84496.1 hypothetical protein [Chloroflexota bacterium]